MSFGDDNDVSPPAPTLPPPPPSVPTFATGIGRLAKSQPRGGTLVTNPLTPVSPGNLARRSLVTS